MILANVLLLLQSYVLRFVVQELRAKHGLAAVAAMAPTGVAAMNIHGMTVHRFAGIGVGAI
jgi:hypothetical protein